MRVSPGSVSTSDSSPLDPPEIEKTINVILVLMIVTIMMTMQDDDNDDEYDAG